MSIKDLFNNPGTPKIQKSVTSDDLVQQVESSEYVKAKNTEFDQFIPPIDFATASNFAKFGSAELYYEKAFERIHQYYPYDGTLAEKTEFHNSSSYLDKYVFDNLYPRTNGYMNFNGTNQYITVFGGPHTASSGMDDKPLESTFDNSMIYDEANKRTSAFEFRGEDGVTIEFWMKAPAASTRGIMQITGAAAGEIKLVMNTSDQLQVTIGSGSLAPLSPVTVLENVIASAANTWNHYAVSIQSSSVGLTYKGFKNGQLKKTTVVGSNIPSILPTTDGLNMKLGWHGAGDLFTGSLDEFRYWKKARTEEEIFNNYFVAIGGGTNKNDANIDLGLYFKFNEGITGTQALDETVLDYSGRINNGRIANYDASMRNTGSAIREKLGEPEFLDPIIYSTHPDVVSKKAEYKTSGSLADLENTSMLLSYFPGWMQEEDAQNGKQLKYLTQVLGSYFDTLWHQISFVNKIHDNHYISGSSKALPFAKKLLYDRGFVMPDLFVDATITENLLQKDDNEIYEKQINEVRNTIYHNLYNNLETIYKSKGTEKSFRNFFRSLGIGENLVKLRMYADDSVFVLRDNYENKSLAKKYLNFNFEGHFDATLYQTSSALNSNIHIPGDTNFSGSFTLETEIILPRKNRGNEVGYLPYPSLTASVVGFHSTGSNYIHPGSDKDLSVYVLKEKLDSSLDPSDSHKVRFMVTGGFGEIITPSYNLQYENNKWNLAVRLKHATYPFSSLTGSVPNSYIAEFYGVEADGSTKRNSFYLTSSIDASYFTSDKIFYAGAHRTNFTGSSLHNTDIKLGFARYWHSYLSNEAIDQHAYDPETFGADRPFENDLFHVGVNQPTDQIPREKTLAFHWAFDNLTKADSSGELLVSDLSSGSANSDYGTLSNIIQRQIQGRAVGFNANAQNALDKIYISTARKRLPDDLMSSDLTTIKSEETEQFFVDDDVSDNFYAFEKSMYGTISDEMMNMFSTAVDFSNVIGQPNQKYHHKYRVANFLRDKFYEDVENEPDIEKFTSFYKWIDDSISIALRQLYPASARFSEKINNIIESHVLERNKYVHQIPILTTFQSTEGSIRGISEMKYDWKNGHAPFFPDEEQTHVLWQRERKEKTGLRENLRTSRNNQSLQSSGLTRKTLDGSTFVSDTYAVRRFAKTYDVSIDFSHNIHGGVNFERKKNLQLFHQSIAPAGAIGPTSGTPQNIITVGVGEGSDLLRGQRNDDNPPRKKKFNAAALIGNRESQEYADSISAARVLPMNLMSGTVHSGYNVEIKSNFSSDVIISNLHHDTVGNYNETSIQGPFTNAHIGGLQYRHVDINKHDQNKSVSVSSINAGSFPTANIKFVPSVLSTKLAAGTGSSVTIRDGDGTIITALYSNVFDLFDNQWTNMDDLIFIINNKLDMTTSKVSDGELNLTQSVTGNFYNHTIQVSSHGFITASGFSGGTALSFTNTSVNLDGQGNRPEGWGLVLKDHPAIGDNDGAFGFVGADYGSSYPNAAKPKATRYREETAKRPINIKNIKTTSSTQKVGNYLHEIELFSTTPEQQRTWARRAYEDSPANILPTSYTTALPNTTHYQTMMAKKPLAIGNVFGTQSNNRQVPENTITKPRTDLTSSQRNINTRFSAPGGPEINTISYLDAYTQTYSAHNAIPFRNLSVLGSGSGEAGTIRVEDHLGLRRGLRALRQQHQGKFGIDSQYGAITATSYPSSGSFNKQHRNTNLKATELFAGRALRVASSSIDADIHLGLKSAPGVYSAATFPTKSATFSWWGKFDEDILTNTTNQKVIMEANNGSSYTYRLDVDNNNSNLRLLVSSSSPYVAATKATGFFKVNGKQHHAYDDFMGLGSKRYHLKSPGQNSAGIDVYVDSGSTDSAFFDNLSSSILAQGDVEITAVSDITAEYSRALACTGKNTYNLSSSVNSSQVKPNAAFTISFWIKLIDFNYSNQKYIYRECQGTDGDRKTNPVTEAEFFGRQVYIESTSGGGNLVFALAGASTALGGAHVTEKYQLEGFASDFRDQIVHVTITHSGTINSAAASAHIYVNGYLYPSLTRSISGSAGIPSTGTTVTQAQPDGVILLNMNTVGSADSIGGSSSLRTTIDQIVVLDTVANNAKAQRLWNTGSHASPAVLQSDSVIPSASIVQYYPFDSGNFNNGDTFTTLGSHPITFTVNTNDNSALINTTDGLATTRKASRTFSLRAPSAGTSGNSIGLLQNPVPPSVNGGFANASSSVGQATLLGGTNTQPLKDKIFSWPINMHSLTQKYNHYSVVFTDFNTPASFFLNGVSQGAATTSSVNTVENSSTIEVLTTTQINFFDSFEASSHGEMMGAIQTFSFVGDVFTAGGVSGLYNNGVPLHGDVFSVTSSDFWRFGNEEEFFDKPDGFVLTSETIKSTTGQKTSLSVNTNGGVTLTSALKYSNQQLITNREFDNDYKQTPIPRSDFQYSWINSSVSGSDWLSKQRILGHAPRDGFISSSLEGFVEAIVFPTASTIFAD